MLKSCFRDEYSLRMQMLRENLKVVKLHNMLQLQILMEKMKQEHEQKLIEEPLVEQYSKDYEFWLAKVREVKQKRKENKFEDDEDYPEESRRNMQSESKRKKNPPRRNRNTRKKRGSIGLSDYNLEESFDDSDKWNM